MDADVTVRSACCARYRAGVVLGVCGARGAVSVCFRGCLGACFEEVVRLGRSQPALGVGLYRCG